MKKYRNHVLFLFLTMMFAAGTAWPAGIRDTRHNLSTTPPSGVTRSIFSTNVNQICVFCHTPHSAISGVTPLWNHNLSTHVYTSAELPSPSSGWTNLLSTVQPPDMGSKLCLSCHDGTVAVGSLSNMPGPGSSGTVNMQGVDANGAIPTTAYGYIGTDLSGSHPVSIAVNSTLIADKNSPSYCASGGTGLNSNIITQNFNDTSSVKLKATGNHYWNGAIDNGPGVTLTSGSGMTYNAGVQCATCHDPHNNNIDFLVVTGVGTAQPALPAGHGPGTNWGSALCTACHCGTCPCP